jgi:membrane-associated phospholipid phosphatase
VSQVRFAAIFLLAAALLHASLHAQGAPEPAPVAVVQPSDAVILGAAAAGSALLIRYDAQMIAWKGLPVLRHSTVVHKTLSSAAIIGGPGALATGAVLYIAGRARDDRVSRIDGEAALEATLMSGVITWAVKGLVGRARPLVDSTRADNFALGRGFRLGDSYESFPSGHVTAAFALATVLTSRLQERGAPIRHWVTPTMFTLASLTALSRMYHHNHWPTDCLAGAAIGTVTGLVTARWHERHP